MIKNIISGVVALFFVLFSLTAFCDRIVISGKPALLNLHPGYFTFPSSYTDSHLGYHYVTLTGINRVCYLKTQPDLSALDMVQIVIEENGVKLPWNCYQYNSRFFEIDY
jgi:hypothetical protein